MYGFTEGYSSALFWRWWGHDRTAGVAYGACAISLGVRELAQLRVEVEVPVCARSTGPGGNSRGMRVGSGYMLAALIHPKEIDMRGYHRGLLSAVSRVRDAVPAGPTVLGQAGPPLMPLVPVARPSCSPRLMHLRPAPVPSISNIAQATHEMVGDGVAVWAPAEASMMTPRRRRWTRTEKPLNLTIKRRVRGDRSGERAPADAGVPHRRHAGAPAA